LLVVTSAINRLAELRVKLSNEVTFTRMRNAMEKLRDTPVDKLSLLADILLGRKRPSLITHWLDVKFADDTLNESQKEAVRFSLSVPEIAVIHGPPGVFRSFDRI
jgi:DNA polymerase alpha-associated DNA helicase A